MVPYNQMKSSQLPPFIKLRNDDGTETIHYSFLYDGVPKELQKMAEVELNETEEKKRKGLQRLREVVKDEDFFNVDDQILLSMLRKCKYNVSKAEKQIVKFLNAREIFIEMFKDVDMKRVEKVLDHMVVGFLPYRDKTGRVIFFSTPNINFELFDMQDCMACYASMILFATSSPMTSIAGAVYIGDSKTPSFDVLYQAHKHIRHHAGSILTVPLRIAKIECTNAPLLIRWTVSLIKPLLTAKSIGRIDFYGSDLTKMRKTYHPDLLPEEFGGTMGPLSNTCYKEELLNFMRRIYHVK